MFSLVFYETKSGRAPFAAWLEELKDIKAKARILTRLNRLELEGAFGDTEHVGDGVFELRFHFGPGDRAYYGKDGKTIIVLLCAGTKRSQKRDIEKAKEYWADYLANK